MSESLAPEEQATLSGEAGRRTAKTEEEKEENIVRYTREEIQERLRRGDDGTDWDRINAMTDEEIERNALEENRRLGIPDDWYKDAYAVMPVEKERITIRIDKDVLDHFRKMGKGYQTRINAVLRTFMLAEKHERKSG